MNALLATGLTEPITSTSRGPLKIQSNHAQHANGKQRSINTPYELSNNVLCMLRYIKRYLVRRFLLSKMALGTGLFSEQKNIPFSWAVEGDPILFYFVLYYGL